jgi:riboflavin synthase
MFTGIVETTAKVLEKTAEGLTLERPKSFTDLTIGCSIAVAGTCLSVVGMDEGMMAFDVVEETWNKTKLGGLKVGDRVNVERSMAATARFEGHVVQGHIEGVGTVLTNADTDNGWMLSIEMPGDLVPAIISKGSIAIDGVSLTVANVNEHICSIALIPHTLEITTLGKLKGGDLVNVETDMFLRGLHHMLMLRMNKK